jgi:ankyrin repeat protein
MELVHLPFDAGLVEYRTQAQQLLDAWKATDPDSIRLIAHHHPRFASPNASWLPKDSADEEIRTAAIDVPDAQLTIARWYDFASWLRLIEYVDAVGVPGSPVFQFESAAQGIVDGDVDTLASLLRGNPALVHARSTRVTRFDPPVHRATLLHYIGANGVENYRQKTAANAVEIATMLLEAGAEVDAVADMYGRHETTMNMLVSSSPPAEAGLQVPLIETLIDYGANIKASGLTSPLMTALLYDFRDAAETLVRRGAPIDNIAAAAGLGRLEEVSGALAAASAEDRHRALSLAAQHGHAAVVRLLLDAGEDPDRYNLAGNHPHTTPLHQAAVSGHDEVVHLLVERHARLDIKDKIYNATPIGWALYSGHTNLAQYLRDHGAKED